MGHDGASTSPIIDPVTGHDERPLPIHGFQGTPEEIEAQWYEQVYLGRGDSMAQLTWRAVLMGSVLGGILSLTNIYIGLKAGWAFGVAITACILSYVIWTTMYRVGLARTPMTILENNCMQSTASSAGYSTGGTLVSAFSAYMMLNGELMPWYYLMAWIFLLAILGVTMAIPMKRQMINVEQLRFPSGVAAAETLRALHATGEKGMRAGRALGLAGLLAALNQFWVNGFDVVAKYTKSHWADFSAACENISLGSWIHKFNENIIGPKWTARTMAIEWDPIFIAAGAITGMRACFSMLLGGYLCWGVFVPIMQREGVIPSPGNYREIVSWTLWGGVACMVTSSLLSFALQWRTVIRAFSGLAKMFGGKAHGDPRIDAIETPGSWFVGGQLFALVGLAWLAHEQFHMPYWQSTLAVVLSFALALVACRVTGETDTTPVGAMGKIMQLTFGGLSPGNMNVNLMSANITAGAAGSSADLLTDLKSGYLLGAHPRKQFIAQFVGIFAGTIVTALAFRLIVPTPAVLGSEQFPAPAAQTWKAVAEMMAKGLSAFESQKIWCAAVGGAVGIILPLLSTAFPKQAKFIPSPAALGLSWTFQFYTACLFFIGAVLGWLWEKSSKKNSDEFLFPIASGIIAGGSLMGVFLAFADNGPGIWEQIRKQFGG